jgi:hypothetical protein
MVSADDIASMTLAEVRTVLTRSEFDGLPAYDETATYHLASVGWLRKTSVGGRTRRATRNRADRTRGHRRGA